LLRLAMVLRVLADGVGDDGDWASQW